MHITTMLTDYYGIRCVHRLVVRQLQDVRGYGIQGFANFRDACRRSSVHLLLSFHFISWHVLLLMSRNARQNATFTLGWLIPAEVYEGL